MQPSALSTVWPAGSYLRSSSGAQRGLQREPVQAGLLSSLRGCAQGGGAACACQQGPHPSAPHRETRELPHMHTYTSGTALNADSESGQSHQHAAPPFLQPPRLRWASRPRRPRNTTPAKPLRFVGDFVELQWPRLRRASRSWSPTISQLSSSPAISGDGSHAGSPPPPLAGPAGSAGTSACTVAGSQEQALWKAQGKPPQCRLGLRPSTQAPAPASAGR